MNVFEQVRRLMIRELLALGIEANEARAEAKLILEYVSKLSFAEQAVSELNELPAAWMDGINAIVALRKMRRPLQYCLGTTGFYGLNLKVKEGVLIPRSDTETLVRVVLDWVRHTKGLNAPLNIAEVGVGAGPITCALLKMLPKCKVWGCDISSEAVELTLENARFYHLEDRLDLVLGDWRLILPLSLDIFVTNPPYITQSQKEHLAKELAFEPSSALFVEDPKGLTFYREFAELLPKHLKGSECFAAFEIGDGQAEEVIEIFTDKNWQRINVHLDFNKLPRVVTASPPS